MRYSKILLMLLAGAIIAQNALATPKFMILPYNQENVVLQQGWNYNDGSAHRGIDWQRNWQSFNVYSCHDGEATYFGGCGDGDPNCNGGLGNYVRIKKNISGTDYYTLYCHLASSPLPQGTPTNIPSGYYIGATGITGAANGVNHLHFEYHEGSIGTKKDPYDIYSTASNYPPNGGSCGANYSWTQCPPVSVTYSCSLHTQDPNAIVEMHPGETRSFTVSYTNTGNTTWQNTGGVSNPNYIELRSCDSSGNVANSWLYPGAPPWINAQRVVSQNATNVQPGQNAWFIFTGKVPNNAGPGDYHIYFQPYHATGGYIQNWGGMNFYIRVTNPESFPSNYTLTPIAGDWNGDGVFEVGVYVVETRMFYLDTNNDGYVDIAITYGDPGDKPVVGDWDGNGTYTIGIYRPSTRTFWLDNHLNGTPDFSCTYGDPGDVPVVGDGNGDGTVTVGIYRPSTRTFWLGQSGSCTVDFGRTFGDPGDVPLIGDWEADNYWTIGLYRPSTRTFFLDYNNDGVPDFVRTYADPGDIPVVGDWNGCGAMRIGIYRPSTQYFWLDYNNDGAADRGFQIRKISGLPRGEVESIIVLPAAMSLSHNFPNPFNVQTMISYSLPQPGHVRLDIYNLLGQKIVTVVNQHQEAGEHQVIWNASGQPSGIYFYRMTTDVGTQTQKMLLLK